MLPRAKWLLLPLVAVLATAAAVRPEPPRSSTPTPAGAALFRAGKVDTVTVLFQCRGTRSVSPWEVTVTSPDDEVVWVLDERSDVDSIEIVPKRGGPFYRWPFQRGDRRGGKGRPATQGGARNNDPGLHRYNVEAMCPGPGNSWRKAVIDPDIIIDF